jgi:ABC-type dipeptide/oligopeptide/nickel transport system ATPase subunit
VSPSPPDRFRLAGVSRFYKGRSGLVPVFQNIHLHIPDRCVTALLGESGSGKSTLAKILLRLEKWDEGEIFYYDTPLEQAPLKPFRRRHQLAPQNPLLWVNPCFRARRILADPLTAAGMAKEEINRRIEGVMDRMELPLPYLDKFPQELSGGELQRITLGRALILEPEFVILDEPFSALDELTTKRLLKTLKLLFDQTGAGALLLSHHSQPVNALADHVVHLGEEDKRLRG